MIKKKFLMGEKSYSLAFFTTVGHPQNINKNHMILPEGLYLNIFLKVLITKIQNLFQKNLPHFSIVMNCSH